jgi:hypothetical protein
MSQPSPVRLSPAVGARDPHRIELRGDWAREDSVADPFDIALTERLLKSTIDSLRADQCRRIEIVGVRS